MMTTINSGIMANVDSNPFHAFHSSVLIYC